LLFAKFDDFLLNIITFFPYIFTIPILPGMNKLIQISILTLDAVPPNHYNNKFYIYGKYFKNLQILT